MSDVKEIMTSYLEKVKTSEYAPLLNALNQMQESPAYAARWSVLADAENTIARLERELATAKADQQKYKAFWDQSRMIDQINFERDYEGNAIEG